MRILRSLLLWVACLLPSTYALAAAPVVSITSPTNGATFTAPATVAITANASVKGGTITRVDFYRGGTTLIGTRTAAPYTITWSGVAAGTYSLTAKATNDAGVSTTSAAVNITVKTQPPVVALTSPVNGSTYSAPADIDLSATASDPDGSVQRVEYYSGARLIGSSTTAPFSTTWAGVGAGSYTLTARAIDNAGAQSTSAPVTVSVGAAANLPPLVAITSPAHCGPFDSRYGLTLTADSVDPDGTVARVEFYEGSTLLGSVDNPNRYADLRRAYSMNWQPSAGTYNIAVKSYDQKGASTTSAPLMVIVTDPATVSITSPVAGAAFAVGSTVAVSADAMAGAGSSIAKVDFYAGGLFLGSKTSAPYTASWTPAYAGNFSISATATDSGGYSVNAMPVPVTVVAAPAPIVSLTSPQPGATYVANQGVALAASAAIASGSIAKVEFFAGATLLATSTASPYTATWTPATPGTQSITAKATSSLGVTAVSAGALVTVTASPPPTVALTAPAAGAALVVQQAVNVAASASASGTARITKVDFHAGNTLVGTVTSAPYAVTWTPATTGSHALTATATDSFGVSAISQPVNVSVQAGPPAVVALSDPIAGSTFSSLGTVVLGATAVPVAGGAAIAKVDFFYGNLLLGTATTAPYTATWPNPAPGTYLVRAVATDVLGVVASSESISVTVVNSAPPTVALTTPTTGSTYTAPASITLSASASAASGASITKVEFYQGTTLVGSATAAPFRTTWNGVPVGSYSVRAVATDSLGVQASSGVATVNVGTLGVTITSPQPGATVTGTRTLVRGTIQAPANSGVAVNGVVASIDAQNNFYAQVPMEAGSNTLTATVTTPTGQTSTASITAASDGIAPFLGIEVSTTEGVSPLPVTYTLTNRATTDATVTFNEGTSFVISPGQETPLTANYQGTGTRFATFTATDAAGNSMSETHVVIVQDRAQLDAKLRAVWNGMNDALIAGDKATAMNALSSSAQASYGPVFDVLMPDMAQIVASFSVPQMGPVRPTFVEYGLTRVLNGVPTVFFIYFVKDASGVWRLDSM